MLPAWHLSLKAGGDLRTSSWHHWTNYLYDRYSLLFRKSCWISHIVEYCINWEAYSLCDRERDIATYDGKFTIGKLESLHLSKFHNSIFLLCHIPEISQTMHRACCTVDKTFVFDYLGKLMWISTNIKIKLIGQDILLSLHDIHIICNNNIYKLWILNYYIYAIVVLWCFTSLSALFQLHYGCSYDVTTQVKDMTYFLCCVWQLWKAINLIDVI